MQFHKYPSIMHFDSVKELEYIKNLIFEWKLEDNFIVQEKIHWANFSIWYDWKTVKYAKRTAFLEDEDFFNYKWMIKNKEKEIKELLKRVWKEEKAKEGIVIYWELIWWHYPDTKVIKEIKTIQAWVRYTNELDFIPFDIFVDTHFLDIKKSWEYFKKSWFLELDTLFEWPLEEALKFDTKFVTDLPSKYNLSHLENNIVEWIVISSTSSNIKFKKKNNEFKESARKQRYEKQSPKLSEDWKLFAEKVSEFLWEDVLLNRFESLISKNWEDILQNIWKTAWLLAKDIVEEIEMKYSEEYNNLEKADKKLIRWSINRWTSLIVKRKIKQS